jgi:hypothetical protein
MRETFMAAKFICKSCELEKEPNPRLKGIQQYCRNPKCQRVRKRAWQKEKMATDAQYRENHLTAQKRWCKQRPLHRYQTHYRQMHPKYVEKNRDRQRGRNAKRRQQAATATVPAELIVKMDASSNIKSGTYLLTPYIPLDASSKIVKMDALVVQLQLLQHDDPQKLALRC